MSRNDETAMLDAPVKTGKPVPKGHYGSVPQKLRDMPKGGYFDAHFTDRAAPFSFARAAGVRITTRKIGEGFYRVWKL